MTNPDTKWANQSRCSVMVSDLLSTVVGGTLWSISICGHLAGQSWSWGFAVPSYLNRGSAGHSCPGTCSAEHGRLVRWSAEYSCFGRGPAGHSCFDRHLAGEIHALVWTLLGSYAGLVGTLVGIHVLSTRRHESSIKTLCSSQMLRRSVILNFITTIMGCKSFNLVPTTSSILETSHPPDLMTEFIPLCELLASKTWFILGELLASKTWFHIWVSREVRIHQNC